MKLIRYVGKKMNENEIHYVDDKDIEAYEREKYILKELKDIYERNDLEDERVQVYCQPVYNIKYGKYDTAEALMRMTLPETCLLTESAWYIRISLSRLQSSTAIFIR